MGISLDLDTEENRIGGFPSIASDTLHINNMNAEEADLIRKTNELQRFLPVYENQYPGKSLDGRISIGKLLSPSLDQIQTDLSENLEQLEKIEDQLKSEHPPEPSTLDFPNLAWEALKAGLAKEKMTNDQLSRHIQAAEKSQKDIDLLLDFSAELTAYKDDAKQMSEKMKDLLAQLKERGIDLWKGEDKNLTKEKISELKSLSSSQVDKLRSNLQILFTTKIQVLIQSIGAIMDVLKDIIRNNTKLINAANRLPGH